MARTLNDHLRTSKRAASPEVAAAREVFDAAYGIARQIIELREKHGLTQTELAHATGVPQAQISRIERGIVSPTSATLGKLAAALGAEVRLVEPPHQRAVAETNGSPLGSPRHVSTGRDATEAPGRGL